MIGKQQEQQPQQETPRLSKEEYAAMRKAEREELQARVDAQAQEVFRDDASMKGFLNFMAQCTPQSTRNLLILYEQDPTITHPRTFDKWKEAGRSLRSGVTGYAFYADQEYEREDGTKGNGFTITKAFDISQTRGQQPLPSQQRLPEEIIAALVAVLSGNVIETLSNPNVFSADPYWNLGILAVPATVIWIVAITNAVNLIDGLDGLACGVSTISSMTLLVIALVVSEGNVAILMAALAGGCIGFLPYNMNPAKIFMGDTGSTFLGYILAVVSIQGLFKFYTIISFAVPFLMLGLPIFDTCFAFIRRIAHGQSPMHADRSHVHHRLIDMGFNQKQAVAVLYVISAILGLSAVVLTTSGPVKAMLLLLALCFAGAISARIFLGANGKKNDGEKPDEKGEEK